MNPAFSDEAWQAYVASQPVVDYDALALEENARMGPFQTGTGATSTQEGIDDLTAFVSKGTKRPAEEERDVFGRFGKKREAPSPPSESDFVKRNWKNHPRVETNERERRNGHDRGDEHGMHGGHQ